jgi:hypothetical protein
MSLRLELAYPNVILDVPLRSSGDCSVCFGNRPTVARETGNASDVSDGSEKGKREP